MVKIIHKGETKTFPGDAFPGDMLNEMVKRLGPWEPGKSQVIVTPDPPAVVEMVPPTTDSKAFSTWDKQVEDAVARDRIEKAHAALIEAGVKVDTGRQLYATGTRMAEEGYANQERRFEEHNAKMSLRDVGDALIARVESEKRRDVTMTAAEFGRQLAVNGRLKVGGLTLREQAIRGLLARLGSPAASYVFGLRDRIAGEASKEERAADKSAILNVLQRECARFPETPLKMRTREADGDVFAVVSPAYAPADAPQVVPGILAGMPDDAKGTWSYNPASTSWEIRAHVWTPTPVAEQAVGEPFEGYASLTSRDNGTGRISGGGGVILLACLNASVYEASGMRSSRVHKGGVLSVVSDLVETACEAIDALAACWGVARRATVNLPQVDGQLVPIEEAIPGFYRAMLTARRGELVGVLPGRSEEHVVKLAAAYADQRRDRTNITRADLANGWTEYQQTFAPDVQRVSERAIGTWLAQGRMPGYVGA